MKLHKILTGLILCALLFGSAAVASADDPPGPTIDLPKAASDPPPPQGRPELSSIQETQAVLDPATAHVTYMEWPEGDDKTLARAVPPAEAPPPVKGGFEPGPIMLAQSDGETLQIIPNSARVANDHLISRRMQNGSTGQDIGIAGSNLIMVEYFEGWFPGTGWSRWDAGSTEHVWGDVNCFAIESGGTGWSAWPAAEGASGLDPCSGANYPNFVHSWLIYGPFSLTYAQSASLDFHFRLDSEAGGDYLKWMASTNGINFYGQQIAGNHTSGPFYNGYNFHSFDLTNVYTLGDLSGEPQVWIAFVFQSDGDTNTGQGPFIDGVSLREDTGSLTYLTDEDFDVIQFPNQFWESFDNDGATNGDYRWDDVNCFAWSDGWSMWPADNGADARDVCGDLGPPEDYPNDARSWLVHGPLNLSDASQAWVDFHFRNESETDWDYFIWMASRDGANYSGYGISGDHTDGPLWNGYNSMYFDLSDVPELGDLRGDSQVYLAFVFMSDSSNTGQGPFLDDVRIIVEREVRNQIFLPVVLKDPSVTQTTLYIENATSGTVSYTVHDTPEGDITCTEIAAGTTVLCGTFTPGTYEVSVSTTECGSNTGEVYFIPGPVTRLVRCAS